MTFGLSKCSGPAFHAGSVFMATTIFLASALLASPALAGHVHDGAKSGKSRLVMPVMNPVRGAKVFVDKGCIACHAINGIGGHDAPNMDVHVQGGYMSPFDFAAKMWNHAPAMIAAQEGAFGEQITFTGSELADIIAFVHDDDAQHAFSEKNLTAKARKMMDHEHGSAMPAKVHEKESGHGHAAGTKPHKD